MPNRITYTHTHSRSHIYMHANCFPLIPLFPWTSASSQVYPGQQYLQGGQYAANTAQYAPGPGQPPGPASSYAGHRLPLQQGMAQSLSAPGPTGLHYKPTEQFNGQGASFNGGSISYSQPGLSGVRGLAGVDGLGGSQGGHMERGHPGRRKCRRPA